MTREQIVDLVPSTVPSETNSNAFCNTLVFFVNGKKVVDSKVDPEWTLLYYLRSKLKLCGTKLGCGEGGCGACTVMVSRYDRQKDQIEHIPVNACLAPVCSMHGFAVTTVEGIGSTKTKLHPVQERIAKSHGSQCGFCTPGIVMSMYTLLRNNPKPKFDDLDVAFQGNLCRCTGYRPILEGYKTFTEEWELIQNGNSLADKNTCKMGEKCCKLKTTNHIKNDNEEVLFKPSEFVPYHPTQEVIFPPELKLYDIYDKQYLKIHGPNVTWYRPQNLNQLLQLKEEYPDAKIVVGNTEVGVEIKFKNMCYPVIIHPSQIPELNKIYETENGLKVGACVTLFEIEEALKTQITTLPENKTRLFSTMKDMLHWFAGKQIRSVGALGSNIMTGSPISDMIPIMMASNVNLEIASRNKRRFVKLDNNFFIGYRKSILKPEEILVSILIPFSKPHQYFYAYKQARRREDDIAIVNICMNVEFEGKSNIISDIKLAFGGMSYKTILALNTQKNLKGRFWNKQTIEVAYKHLLEDLPLDPGAPGGMIEYRRSLTLSLFFKGYLFISNCIKEYVPSIDVTESEYSALKPFSNEELKSSQYFRVVPETQEKYDALQRPIVHNSAYKQATGEAVYCDDIPHFQNELFMAFVLSTEANARITSIDYKDALSIDGVHRFFDANDLDKEHLYVGTIVHDEKVFYSDEVTSQGQIIGAIVAENELIARRAAKKVKVVYEKRTPVILTIEDAINHNSFLGKAPYRIIEKGDIKKVLKEAPHVLKGDCKMGGQEHFYLETNSVIAVPKAEDNELELFCSTQNPTEISKLAAKILNLTQNKVITKVKRLGGGFGGKESKAVLIGIPAAVVAFKMRRPIRAVLDRDEDIIMTGGRHPFQMKYSVAFNNEGKILGCKIQIYCNAGYSVDLSPTLLERAMTHFENAYKIPVVHVTGYMCKTNLPSNTAFRGFGGPQGMYAAECMIQHIASYLKRDVVEVSEINLYKEGDKTHYGQKLINCTLDKCWKECVTSSNYFERKKEVELFNRKNQFKKRGLSIIPTKYGIAFTAPHLNQGGALVLVYDDGSVLLSHGGVEMGQGLYTKTLQVASRTLGIPIEYIHISETSTDKVPNTSPTAASSGSDLNGMATMEACKIIRDRLEPLRKANPNATWKELIKKAYFERISLAATGYHKTPDIGYNWETGEGNMFNYFTYGVACSEVEIDTLTGDHNVIRTDIVMDLGESLNPAIDIGQIEGAFMQGYGLFLLEEMVYSPNGMTYTRGPGTYKIPGFGDIPKEFNVSLLKGVSNPRAVYSSKAVGEPPLFLASSVFFAVKDAIRAAREENGYSSIFTINSPATAARIRMACQDNITSKIKAPIPGSFKPWNVEI